jgi:hypothetical protein
VSRAVGSLTEYRMKNYWKVEKKRSNSVEYTLNR